MSFFKNHIFGLGAFTTFGMLAVLVIWGHSDELDHHLNVPELTTYGPQVPDIVMAYYNQTDTPKLRRPLLNALVPKRSPIKRLAFAILLSCKPEETQLKAYLHYTQFAYHAENLFNVPHQMLNPGEILLLCDLAMGRPIPQHDPDAAIARRNHLLTQIYKKGALTDRQYHTERKRALALAADHRPVY